MLNYYERLYMVVLQDNPDYATGLRDGKKLERERYEELVQEVIARAAQAEQKLYGVEVPSEDDLSDPVGNADLSDRLIELFEAVGKLLPQSSSLPISSQE